MAVMLATLGTACFETGGRSPSRQCRGESGDGIKRTCSDVVDFTWANVRDMKSLALALIAGYQRHLSPLKGFRCALRAHTGCASCSSLGYRAIRMKGLFAGLGILRTRLYLCGVAHRRYGAKLVRPPRGQRGDCDVGCVDLPIDGDCGSPGGGKSSLCEALRCLDAGSCDWPTRDRKKKRKGKSEGEIHLPPKT